MENYETYEKDGILYYTHNNVRVQLPGYGTAFGRDHKEQLDISYTMTDVDNTQGIIFLNEKSENEMYHEYVMSGDKMSVVAVIDLKASERAAKKHKQSLKYHLLMCRKFKVTQLFAPRFFYIFGQDFYTMVEIDIDTGQELERWVFHHKEMKKYWNIVGLTELRRKMEKSIDLITPDIL